MATDHPKIIVIAGPTASGKTDCGIDLAEEIRGEIVSADSIQIYRYMDIGSAKPSPVERSRVPHHMIDIRDPDEDFSAGDYVREARRCMRDVLSRGMVPLVVGGTGLYIRLLLGGIVELPRKDPALREKLRVEEAVRPGSLYERLLKIDPETAHATPDRNAARIVRALEVYELTGRPISRVQQEHALQDRPYNTLFVCIAPDREVLYERIDTRVDSMIKGGLFEEVGRLYDLGFTRELKPLQSLGYRHAGMVIAGEVDEHEAIRLMKRDTRHFAKRQMTWFRSEPDAAWFDPKDRPRIRFAVANFLGR
ncbi:MAG: tRNA (adenosine(37)-N6)-dimethylallyltransferase MiaA [Desulfomonilaceae bacterium]|nr:tRNA (adenosine(37)-N6)-dimethylallyltransferase MiaA [Desulfomonilaceae bacterium]